MSYGLIAAIAGSLGFGILTMLNLVIGRSWLYPGVVLCGSWTISFLCLCVTQSWLYSVSWSAIGVFLAGATSFSVAAAASMYVTRSPWEGPVHETLPIHRSDELLLLGILVLLVLSVPAFLALMSSYSTAPPFSPLFFLEIRQATVLQQSVGNRAPVLDNLVVLSNIAALIAIATTGGGRRKRWMILALFLCAGFYNLLTGAKAGLIGLIVTAVATRAICHRRVPIALVGFGATFFVLVFGLFVGFRATVIGGESLLSWETAALTLTTLMNYLTTSLVAFSEFLKDVHEIEPVWSPWTFFMRSANYFGDFFDLPQLHAAYVNVGPELTGFNTYTIYFSYYPGFGIVGACALMTLVGIGSGFVYAKAKTGSLLWVLLYATVIYGLASSIFNEALLMSLNPTIKLVAMVWIFSLARRLRMDSGNVRRQATSSA